LALENKFKEYDESNADKILSLKETTQRVSTFETALANLTLRLGSVSKTTEGTSHGSE